MKYLKEYNTVEEYIEDVSSNPVSYPTLTRVVSDSNWGKKMFYRKVMTDESNPEAMSIARSAGWVGQNDTYMTMEQALAVTDETFRNGNIQVEDENAYNGYTSTFSELKHFDEFQYFLNVKNITRVKVSDDPYTAKGSFMCSYNLKNLKLPPQIFELGNVAFRWCEKLTDLVLPSSTKQISSFCFYDCTSLKRLKFNTGLNVILDYAFIHTDIGWDVEPIQLPETLTYIGNQVFSYNNWYFHFAETLNLPRIRFFGYENFINQCGPRYLNMGANLETLGNGPDYTGQYNDVFWGELEAVTIDSECPNFKVVNNIVYSKDGTICYGGAEFGLSKQSVVKVADGCTKVIAGAFRGFMQKGSDSYILQRCPWYDPNEEICEYLVFPASVTYIGDRVCQYSKTNIVMLGTTPPTYVSYAFISSYNIYVPEEAVDTYKAATGWSGQTKRIKAITPEILAVINS